MDNSMWEKIKKGLKDGASLSIEKIEEYAKIGKLKIEELATKRKIEHIFIDLGERTFDLIESGKSNSVGGDLAIKKSIENVNALRAELVEIDGKIREIQEMAKKNKDEEETEINGL
jgi:hypothetical protein